MGKAINVNLSYKNEKAAIHRNTVIYYSIYHLNINYSSARTE